MIQQHLYDAANTSTEDQLSLLLSLSMSPTRDPENCRLPNTRIIKPMSPVSECSFYCSLFIIVFKTESPVSWRGRLHTQSVAQLTVLIRVHASVFVPVCVRIVRAVSEAQTPLVRLCHISI